MTAREAAVRALERQKADMEDPTLPARRQAWLDALERLATQIAAWTQELERQGLLQVQTPLQMLNEPRLGIYSARSVELLTPAGDTVAFRPVATFIAGADGRVDVHGPRGTRKLVWERDSDQWRFVDLTLIGRWSFTKLNEDTFWAAVQGLFISADIEDSQPEP